ncbi:helix-turn-helix domain-containing protein [Pseudomonas sp. 2835]|uniref:helix-turn-helix domain-containing protein n=1 Tax=Pseudomonas sp. 2835 TaxID=3156451 RepID=UPI003D20BD97
MHLSEEIGARLQSERKRLNLNQEQFAGIVGVSKRTLASYEAGTREPGALLLNLAACAGVDVLFVITGQPLPVSERELSVDEIEMVNHVRELGEEDKGAVRRLLMAFSRKP